MLGQLISAGSNLIGGLMSARETAANREAQLHQAALNMQAQEEFAKKGIRWRVADARAAGIHPLFALGAQTHSYSPVGVGSLPSSGLPNAIANMGQDIGRAINATRTQQERDEAYQNSVRDLTLEKARLENDVLRTSLASSVQRLRQQANPPMPDVGPVPEKAKFEERPKLMFGGVPVVTDPLTSNTQSAEDRYGDEGPASWLWGLGTMWRDYQATSGGLTREKIARGVWEALKWIENNTRIYGR